MVKKTKEIRIVGDIKVVDNTIYKVCTLCKETKTLDKFGLRQLKRNNPDLLYSQPQCVPCRGIRVIKKDPRQLTLIVAGA